MRILLLTLSLLLFSLSLSQGNPPSLSPSSSPTKQNSCEWTDPNGKKYDFSGISKPEGWKMVDLTTSRKDNLYNIDFMFNFCEPVKSVCSASSNAAVFQVLDVLGQTTDACEIYGLMDQREVTVGTSLGVPGVRITYKGGSTCTSMTNLAQKGQPKQTSFNIICDGTTDHHFTQMEYDHKTITVCSPEFYIHHPAGCVGGVYHRGFGIGHWLLLLFIGYVVIGTAYNLKIKQKKGIEAFPNYNLWKQTGKASKKLPEVIQALGTTIWNKAKRAKPTRSSSNDLMKKAGLVDPCQQFTSYTSL